MKSPFPRAGVLVALAIPTDAHRRVRKRALATHLAWLRERGVAGVLGLGSTGEFPFFSLEERKAVLEIVAELAAPLPVIANISDVRPGAVAELARFARRFGLPGVSIMPPSFFPVSAADQLAFFLRAADVAQLPVMLYNFPELTGNRIALETVAAFADRAPMAAIKQSGREFSYHEPLVALGREKGYAVFSGADTRLPEVFALGAAGCIGGLVNFMPEFMVETYRICHQGTPGDPAAITARMREVGAIIDRLTFPLNVAAGLEARGFDAGERKTIVSRVSERIYRGIVTDLRKAFRAWELPLAQRAPTKRADRLRSAGHPQAA